MSARLSLTDASVLPFQFPPLKEEEVVVQTGAETAIADPVSAANGIGHALPPAPPVSSMTAEEEERDRAAAIAAELTQARAEGLERGLAEGREQGYAAGFAEGRNAGEAEIAEQARRLTAIIGELGRPLAAVERKVEEAIAALALEVARCVIGDEVKHSREFLVRLVREAISKVPLEMGAPRVLLNLVDLELIRTRVPEVDAGRVTLVEDDTTEAGGCRVIADGDDGPIRDRRWNPRAAEGVSQVDLTLSARWRAVMLTLFDGEG
jgi:flagellar assembly protein FliH